ncbi:MAG: hypothetical protein K0S47_2198 [Herbinix sp.]|jgi:hypothetical protein|nr:hypothetical protein [Herbinix sp.]
MDKPSFKKYLINSIYAYVDKENMNNKKVIIITTTGYIYGTLVKDHSYFGMNQYSLHEYTNNLFEQYCIEYDLPEKRLNDNDGFLELVDAIVYIPNPNSFDSHNRFSSLFVFYDQIVSIAIGDPL